MGVLENRVVIVSGGGNGIGKACALLAAEEGAKVVVSDLGGAADGRDDGSMRPAQEVVDEIKARGGEAVANFDSVTDRNGVKHLIEQALDEFGDLHSVINTAGILRDKMFHKLDDADWDAVLKVHLEGSYNIARAAVNYFREKEDGSIILFGSTSGLIGNIGQANYSAAKAGIAGMSRIIAMENASKNVRSNVVCPFAWTRMIGTIPVKDEATKRKVELMQSKMRADQPAMFCVALASPQAKDVTGQVFVVRGNEVFLMSQSRPLRGIGRGDGWTAETLLSDGIPALRGSMYSLESTSDVFTWDPV